MYGSDSKQEVSDRVVVESKSATIMGIEIKAVFACLEGRNEGDEPLDFSGSVSAYGEIHYVKEDTLFRRYVLHMAVYNSNGQVISATSTHMDTDRNMEFDIFEMNSSVPLDDIHTIRIFPARND